MRKISFVYPTKTKPVSITGNSCALSCAHCKGHYLKHMENYWDNKGMSSDGIKSYLVSGGCNLEGAVPLGENLDLLKRLSLDHTLIAHTGLLKDNDIELISPYITAASFNFIGDDKTIKEVMGLEKTKEDFIDCLNTLRQNFKTIPHITIGLNKGMITGEYDWVDLLAQNPPEALVLNVLIPTAKTDYERCEPPKVEDVIDVISYAKERLPNTSLYIGCMRPGGAYREKLDRMCVEVGVNRIVMPSKSAKMKAAKMELEIEERMECCIL